MLICPGPQNGFVFEPLARVLHIPALKPILALQEFMADGDILGHSLGMTCSDKFSNKLKNYDCLMSSLDSDQPQS